MIRAYVHGLAWLLLLTMGLTCSPPRGTRAPTPARPDGVGSDGMHYTFEVAKDLSSLNATVCFYGALPKALRPPSPSAASRLQDVRHLKQGWAHPMSAEEGWIDLDALTSGDCVAYRVDLSASSGWRAKVRRFDDDLFAPSDVWMWEPKPRPQNAEVTAAFELPENVQVAVPWIEDVARNLYVLDQTAFRWTSNGALGRFELERFEVGHAELRLAVLGASWTAEQREQMATWVVDSAAAVAALFGDRFPVPRALVVVVPSRGDEVVFGSATRGGGSGVTLYVGRDIDATGIAEDWVAVHELFHLGVPFVDRDDAWLSEGLATYYGPVLRARAGLMSARDAWEELHDGFVRGEAVGHDGTLREDSASFSHPWRVYWGGAAVVFLADVGLRLEGSSLDARLQALNACCLGAYWEADALLEEVPDLADQCEAHLEQEAFPDVSAAYQHLGLRFDGAGRLLTRPGDPGAAQRIAIMGRDVEP